MLRIGLLLAIFVLSATARAADDCAPRLRLSLRAEVGEAGVLYIPLTVDGRTTKVLFCTSCAWSSLGERFVDAAGIRKRHGRMRFVDPAGNEPNYFVRAEQGVKLGDMEFAGKAEFLVDENRDVGTFGLNLMANFDVELDNAKGVISFYRHAECRRPSLPWLKDAFEIPFDTKDGYPKGVVELKGRQLHAGISTGLSHSSMELAIARYQLGVTPQSPGMTRMEGVRFGDKVYDRYGYLLRELKISGLRFANVPLTILDLNGYGIDLGMHELRLLRLYIGFKSKKIYAAPIAAR